MTLLVGGEGFRASQTKEKAAGRRGVTPDHLERELT